MLSQRGRAMLHVCQLTSIVQYVAHNLLLLAILPLQIHRCVQIIMCCSLLFVVVVHAGCDKHESLMRGGLCGKLYGVVVRTLYQSSIRSPNIRRESRFLPTPPAFDALVKSKVCISGFVQRIVVNTLLTRYHFPSQYCHDVRKN